MLVFIGEQSVYFPVCFFMVLEGEMELMYILWLTDKEVTTKSLLLIFYRVWGGSKNKGRYKVHLD